MADKEKALAVRRRQAPPPVLEVSTLSDVMALAERLAKSNLVPKEYQDKPENILVAMQMGAEVGLRPMQALQSIAVINGRPSLWGDAGLAIIMAHPDFEWIKEDDDSEKQLATCTIKRRGLEPVTRTFSQAEAEAISVYERDKWIKLSERAVWRSYKKRMRQMRARWWATKDSFADALKGLDGREWIEADLSGTVVEAEPEPSESLMPRRKGELPASGNGGKLVAQGAAPKGSVTSPDPPVEGARQPVTSLSPVGGPIPDPWEELRGLMEGESGSTHPSPQESDVDASGAQGKTRPGPTNPLEIAPGALTFELNGQPVTTAGITKETILKAFKLGALADELVGKGTAKNLLGAEFGLEHRQELTEPQGKAYVAALTKIVNKAQAEKSRGK